MRRHLRWICAATPRSLDNLRPDAMPIVWPKILACDRLFRSNFNFHATFRWNGALGIRPLAYEYRRYAEPMREAALCTAFLYVVDELHARTIAICFWKINSKLRIPHRSSLLLNAPMTTSKETRLQNLKRLVQEMKTIEAAARAAGTSPAYLSQILNGAKSSTGQARGVGDALARKLEVGCGKPEGWLDVAQPDDRDNIEKLLPGAMPVLVSDEDDDRFYQIRKVRLKLQAGITGFQTVPDVADGGYVSIPKYWVHQNGFNPQKLISLSVTGESMEPRMHSGDTVVVNTADTEIKDGLVYAVNYEGESVIKRLVRDAGDWWLVSDNSDQRKFGRKLCRGGECLIVGRVVRLETENI
jgi:phage repressor protein C with HTH and peptisase S24 domain